MTPSASDGQTPALLQHLLLRLLLFVQSQPEALLDEFSAPSWLYVGAAWRHNDSSAWSTRAEGETITKCIWYLMIVSEAQFPYFPLLWMRFNTGDRLFIESRSVFLRVKVHASFHIKMIWVQTLLLNIITNNVIRFLLQSTQWFICMQIIYALKSALHPRTLQYINIINNV